MADEYSGGGSNYPAGSFYADLATRIAALEVVLGTAPGSVPDGSITVFKLAATVIDKFLQRVGGTLTGLLIMGYNFPSIRFGTGNTQWRLIKASAEGAAGNFTIQHSTDGFTSNFTNGLDISPAGAVSVSGQFTAGSFVIAGGASGGFLDPSGNVGFKGAMATQFGNTLSEALAGYQGALQTPTLGGSLTATHGLGHKPVQWWAVYECTVIDNGWAVGDTIILGTDNNGGGYGISVTADATTLTARVGANGIGISNHKTTGAAFTMNATSWKVRLCAR